MAYSLPDLGTVRTAAAGLSSVWEIFTDSWPFPASWQVRFFFLRCGGWNEFLSVGFINVFRRK